MLGRIIKMKEFLKKIGRGIVKGAIYTIADLEKKTEQSKKTIMWESRRSDVFTSDLFVLYK